MIDDIATDTVQAATHVLPDVAVLAKDGSVTNADRQILRLHAATRPTRAAQSAGRHLQDLATQLAKELQREPPPVFQSSADVMDAIAAEHPLYAQAQYSRLLRALRQASNGATAQAFQTVEPASAPAQTAGSGLVLVATRDLSTDRSAAALRLADADRLHRGEFLEMHPGDAAARNIADGAAVQVRTGRGVHHNDGTGLRRNHRRNRALPHPLGRRRRAGPPAGGCRRHGGRGVGAVARGARLQVHGNDGNQFQT